MASISIRTKLLLTIVGVVLAAAAVLAVTWIHVNRLNRQARQILADKSRRVAAAAGLEGRVSQAVGCVMRGLLQQDPNAREAAARAWRQLGTRLDRAGDLAENPVLLEQFAAVRRDLKRAAAQGRDLLEMTARRAGLYRQLDQQLSELLDRLHEEPAGVGEGNRPKLRPLEDAVQRYASNLQMALVDRPARPHAVPEARSRLERLLARPDLAGTDLRPRIRDLLALGSRLLEVDQRRNRALQDFSAGSLVLDAEVEETLIPSVRGRAAQIARLAGQSGRWELVEIMLISLLLVGLTGLVGLHVARRLTRSTRLLSDGARRLGQGDLSWRIDLDGKDEFACPARRFNEMAERLQLREDQSRQIRRQLGREVRIRTDELEQQRLKLQALASQLSAAEDRSRRRIAADLHDQVSQSLVAAMTKVDMTLDGASEQQAAPLEEVYQTLGRVLEDVRSLTFQLCPPMLHDLGLESGLRWLAEQFDGQDGLSVTFRSFGAAESLDDRGRSELFRAARELLINAAKHAAPCRVEILSIARNDRVELRVKDDGPGFHTPQLVPDSGPGGFGLFGIRQRIEALGGGMSVRSESQQGANVSIWLPARTKASTPPDGVYKEQIDVDSCTAGR